MALRSGQRYSSELFTPPPLRPYPDTDTDRITLPGTVAVRSGTNEVIVTATAAQITAFKTAVEALDSDTGLRGIPVVIVVTAQAGGSQSLRASFWTTSIAFTTLVATLDLDQVIDIHRGTQETVVASGYVITQPSRIDDDGFPQGELPVRDRPVAAGTGERETVTLRVEDVRVEPVGTIYTGYFFADSTITGSTRIVVTDGADTEEFGFLRADDEPTPQGAGKTRWDVQIADEDTIEFFRRPQVAAQQPTQTIASVNGFTSATLAGNVITFTRPDGTTDTLTLPGALSADITGVDIVSGQLVVTTRGGVITRTNLPAAAESQNDFVMAAISGNVLTLTRRDNTFATITIPVKSDGDIDARILIATGQATTTSVFDVSRIPNIPASRVTSGEFLPNRIPTLDIVAKTSGDLPQSRVQNLSTALAGKANTSQIPGAATTSVAGIVELATDAETRAGASSVLAVTPSGIRSALAGKADTTALPSVATTSSAGLVELATSTEAETGTDTSRAMTPAAARSAGDNRYRRTGVNIAQSEVENLSTTLAGKADTTALPDLTPYDTRVQADGKYLPQTAPASPDIAPSRIMGGVNQSTSAVWAREGNTDLVPRSKYYGDIYDFTPTLYPAYTGSTRTPWRTVTPPPVTPDAWAFSIGAVDDTPIDFWLAEDLGDQNGTVVASLATPAVPGGIQNLLARVTSGGSLQVRVDALSTSRGRVWTVAGLAPKVGTTEGEIDGRVRAHTGQGSVTGEFASGRLPDATTSVKGAVIRADAAAITAGTAGRVPDAAQLKESTSGLNGRDDLALTVTNGHSFTLPVNWQEYAGLEVIVSQDQPRSRFFSIETLGEVVTGNNVRHLVSLNLGIRSPTNSRAIIRSASTFGTIVSATLIGGAAGRSGLIFRFARIYIRVAVTTAQPATPTAATVTVDPTSGDFVYANLPTNWTSDLGTLLVGLNPTTHRIWESARLYDGRDGSFEDAWRNPLPFSSSDYSLPTLSLSGVTRTIPNVLEAMIQPLVTSGEVTF